MTLPPSRVIPRQTVIDVFKEIKKATDEFIVDGELGSYHDEVIPRSTALCIVHILNAFEELGCSVRSASPGQSLERVQCPPRHEKYVNEIYKLLEHARLVDTSGSEITRTAVAPPTKSAEALLEELLHDEPDHEAELKLVSLAGLRLADCITGKEEAIQLIFGTREGREIVTDLYARSPFSAVWIQQTRDFLEQLIKKLPKDGEPLRILEMGAGTGGTTFKIVPLLGRLGVPVEYTMTDLSSFLIATARKRFQRYSFVKFRTLNIESEPEPSLVESQHIILATNCVHATRNLTISATNIHRMLRPDGFLLLVEMTAQVPWVDFVFGLLEGWWLFEDGRNHALQPATHWEKVMHSVGFGHVDWTEGSRPEASLQRLIIAHASGPRSTDGH